MIGKHRTAGGLFVAGTDTGVGKTTVSRALLHTAFLRGLRWLPIKPVETGVTEPPSAPTDGFALHRAAGRPIPLPQVCPFTFAQPVAPVVAARAAGVALPFASLLEACHDVIGLGHPVLVESAGGLLTPLTDHQTNADLAADLGLPVLLVARNGLGTINHTALALAELRRRRLEVVAVILVQVAPPAADASTNASCISALCGINPWGPMPYHPHADDTALSADLQACLRPTQLEQLLSNRA